jgi:hypothetical protein
MPHLALPLGFIGDGPSPYNASLLLEGAMPEPVIVNVNLVAAGNSQKQALVLRSECAQINI